MDQIFELNSLTSQSQSGNCAMLLYSQPLFQQNKQISKQKTSKAATQTKANKQKKYIQLKLRDRIKNRF